MMSIDGVQSYQCYQLIEWMSSYWMMIKSVCLDDDQLRESRELKVNLSVLSCCRLDAKGKSERIAIGAQENDPYPSETSQSEGKTRANAPLASTTIQAIDTLTGNGVSIETLNRKVYQLP